MIFIDGLRELFGERLVYKDLLYLYIGLLEVINLQSLHIISVRHEAFWIFVTQKSF